MKTLRQIFAVTVLTFVLACSAFAGEMSGGNSATITGEMSGGVAASTTTTLAGEMSGGYAETTNPITEIALTILQNVLALF
jgi:carbohydrate-selective porin OprB